MDEIRPGSDRRPELGSWKEVAGYLRVSIRTAQNWETRLDLPVRRLPGTRGRVVADPDELDSWKRRQPETQVSTTADKSTPTRWTRLSWLLMVAAAGVLVVCLVVWGYFHKRHVTVVSAHLMDGQLVALDQRGRELWRHTFQPSLNMNMYGVASPRRDFVWTGDLDGDGRNEVLFAANAGDDGRGDLICLGHDGQERWRYRPHLRERTRNRELPDSWVPAGLAVGSRQSGRLGIWASFLNAESSPSVVVRLSPEGKEEAYYGHSGHLGVLRLWKRNPEDPTVLVAGGINNRLSRATLVVLDPEELSGVSDETGQLDEQLMGPVSTSELFRAFFGMTDLGRVATPYNGVQSITTSGGRLIVETDENLPNSGSALVRYELDQNLKILGVRFHDSYKAVHAQFLARGLLTQPFTANEAEALRVSCQIVVRGVPPTPGVLVHLR